MDTTGLEPVTPTMSTWCSNQLSYASERIIILARGKWGCKGFVQQNERSPIPPQFDTAQLKVLSPFARHPISIEKA